MIPVLVHNDKSVVESLVILEYIDETWKNAPKLFQEDPYLRVNVRFLANFLDKEVFESMRPVITTHGEAEEKILRDVTEKLKMMEKQMQDLFPGEKPLVDGKNLGLLYIVVISVLGCYKAAEEAANVKLIDPQETPFIFSWVTALNELPLVKETIQPHSKMAERFRYARQKALQSMS
ncbi:glutathione s-transferase u10 [Nicotiana attenuata]|uniref:Glutathione S-transferase n=2 Tax=Nicotiana attenuata TaxID=49451 RepID=A0A1J6IJF1_NICAT|nr:glutathione s-transferase u10 [Nicotiana attenuata]